MHVQAARGTADQATEDDDRDDHNCDNADETPTAIPAEGKGAAVTWYERAYDYWEDDKNCGLDDNGVLGGYGHISPTDIEGSKMFLDELQTVAPLLGHEKAAGSTPETDVAQRAAMSVSVCLAVHAATVFDAVCMV